MPTVLRLYLKNVREISWTETKMWEEKSENIHQYTGDGADGEKFIYKSACHSIICNICYSTVERDANKFRVSGFWILSSTIDDDDATTTQHSAHI